MAQLTIKGHPTRGNEVIALLEMLGGINEQECDGTNSHLWYSIDGLNEITFFTHTFNLNNHEFFTLEEFLERFPYKVGDKVYYYNKVYDVIEMRWNSILNTISYGVYNGKVKNLAIVEELKPYEIEVSEEFYNKYCVKCGSQRCTCSGEWLKECEYYRTEVMSKNICDSCLNLEGCLVYCDKKKQEMEKESKTYKEKTMEETKKDLDWHPTDYLEFENNNDTWADEVEVNLGNDYEIQVRDGKTFIVRKQPQYQKTYEECCTILNLPHNELTIDVPLHYSPTLIYLTKLLLCRDAYWKIAGEQMGLGKPWQPDYTNPDIDLYVIINIYNRPKKARYGYGFQHCIFTFPTEEMRDAFYKNFKELIEQCKELL